MKLLPSMNNLIDNILKLIESKYYTQSLRYLQFCDTVYSVPTWSLFAGLVTNYIDHFVITFLNPTYYAGIMLDALNNICDRAYENRPCKCKLHRVIFSLISFVPNALSHFRKMQKKAH